MSASRAAATPARRGRPSTGARERILAAAVETLKREGYAGLTIAKVAARAGESKALIAYHYGSKNGLIAAAGRAVAEAITERVVGAIEGARTVEQLVRRIAVCTEQIADEDPRILRVYFDLTAVSVVEPELRRTIAAINARWRELVTERLMAAEDSPAPGRAPAMTLLVIAGIQGLSLERIESDQGPELERARELFVRSVSGV